MKKQSSALCRLHIAVCALVASLTVFLWDNLDIRPASPVVEPELRTFVPAKGNDVRERAEDGVQEAVLAMEEVPEIRSAPSAPPPLTLVDFPEETRGLVAAAEGGRPVRVDLGGSGLDWVLRPITVTAENFRVSTGSDSAAMPALRVYSGKQFEPNKSGSRQMILGVAGNRMAALLYDAEGILHVTQAADGSWRMEREVMVEGAEPCTYDPATGVHTTPDRVRMEPWKPESWDNISIAPAPVEVASEGKDPLDDEFTLTDRPIPYGQAYADSLKTILAVMVVQNAGLDTPDNINRLTANYLAVAGGLQTLYENQIGANYVYQELILVTDGSDFNTPDFDGGPVSPLSTFYQWMGVHRPQATYRWHIASKIGSTNANGTAFLNGVGSATGVNANSNNSISLLGHEIGHNLGSNHTRGGIMNASATSSRNFFHEVDGLTPKRTGAKDIWTRSSPRIGRAVAMRDAAEIPFANDDTAMTTENIPVVLLPLQNDLTVVPFGATNTLTLVETGEVFPPGAGTTSFTDDTLTFMPALGFSGRAYFSYTIRGSIGNGGKGWLHKGDVGIVVTRSGAEGIPVTAERGSGLQRNDRVELSWTPPAQLPQQWEIERSTNGGPFVRLGTTPGNSVGWIDLSVSLAASVRYRVREHDGSQGIGHWGLSNLLPAEGSVAWFDDFRAGHAHQWNLVTSSPGSEDIDDAATSRFALENTADGMELRSTGPAQRIGLLVRRETVDVNADGAQTFSLDLAMNRLTRQRRIVAWLDDGGAVIWIGLERNLGTDARKIRLYAADSVGEFNQWAGEYDSPFLMWENIQNNTQGDVVNHRCTLTISPSGVAMTAVPLDYSFHANLGAQASTLGLRPHGLSTFTGVGRFAAGGYAHPSGENEVRFTLRHASLSSEAVPDKHLPAMVGEVVDLRAGESVQFQPLLNDRAGMRLVNVAASQPPGLTVTKHEQIIGVHADPSIAPGSYWVNLSSSGHGYQNLNDGLSRTSSSLVRVLSREASAKTLRVGLRRGEGGLTIHPLANDDLSGRNQPADIVARVRTDESRSAFAHSHQLLNARLTTASMGSIELETLTQNLQGVLTPKNTGAIRFTLDPAATGTLAQIAYSFRDSRRQEKTGLILIDIVEDAAPVIETHPQSQAVAAGGSFSFSVTASGAGPQTFQWFRNGTVISGATGSTFNVAATAGNAGEYHVDVGNSSGSVRSLPAIARVLNPLVQAPVIVSEPMSRSVAAGESVQFAVQVEAIPAASYIWYRNGNVVSNGNGFSGATTKVLSIAAAGAGNAGSYHVVAQNSEGTAQSQTAALSLELPVPQIVLQRPLSEEIHLPFGSGLFVEGNVLPGNPSGPAPQVAWSRAEGPDAVTFAPANAVNTAITFAEEGIYILRLRATEETREAIRVLRVVVNSTPKGSPLPTDNLALWLGLDESRGTVAADASGNGRDALFHNTPAWHPDAGRAGGALAFNGSNQHLRLPHDAAFEDVEQISFSFWIRRSGTSEGILSKRVNGSTARSWGLFLSNGNLMVDIGTARADPKVLIPANQWTHVAVVFDGTLPQSQRLRTYYNGALQSTSSMNITRVPTGGADITIGASETTATRSINARLDEVAIYPGRALTPQEISWLNLANPLQRAPSITFATPPNTVAGTPAALTAMVADDGIPGDMSLAWSKISGPGAVSFSPPNQAETTVLFTQAGAQVLRLTADDGDVKTFRDLAVGVQNAADSNANGIPDAWEQAVFGNLTTTQAMIQGRIVPAGDVYVWGLNDPLNALFAMEGMRFQASEGRMYDVEYSDDLRDPMGWRTLPGHDGLSAPGGHYIEILDADPGPRRVYRVKVRLP